MLSTNGHRLVDIMEDGGICERGRNTSIAGCIKNCLPVAGGASQIQVVDRKFMDMLCCSVSGLLYMYIIQHHADQIRLLFLPSCLFDL
jgi:hypothetical protein